MNTFCQHIRRTFATFVLLIVVLHPAVSNAQTCSYTTGSAADLNATPPATISVPRDAAIGTRIYTSGKSIHPSQTFNIACSSKVSIGVQNAAGAAPAAGSVDFPIGNTGLSWRFLNMYGTAQAIYPMPPTGSSWGSNPSISYTVEIWKTGPIPAGTTIPAGVLGTYQFGTLTGLNIMLNSTVTITQPACSTSDVTVDMGTPGISAFKGVGSRIATRPFAINLTNCPTGIKSVAYQLDTTTSIISASAAVVALNPASSATGVGLQILDKSFNPVTLGTPIPFASYTTAGGNFVIPFNIGYYQTDSVVTPGTAIGSLTFTMTYQ